MDIKMIKKSMVMVLLLVTTLQAENIFLKLPYNMQIGKKIPKTVEKKMKMVPDYDGWYEISDILELKLTKDYILKRLYVWYPHKIWRRAGIKMCTNKYETGTSYEKMKTIIKNNGVSYIDESISKSGYLRFISFDIDKDNEHYNYSLKFYIKPKITCKGGLRSISISPLESDDEY